MPASPTIHACAVPEGRRGLVLGFAVHEDRIYAVGGQGADLFLTSDDGASFKQGSSPGRGLRSVMARSDGVWVVGEYGYVARSNDQGKSWKPLPTKSHACLFGVAEDDAGTVWVGGEGSSLWKSKDGNKLTRVADIQEAIGRLVTSPLGVLVPTDTPGHLFFIRGRAIEQAPFEAGVEIMQATVTPRGTIVTAGLKGTVWRSDDSGKTFERIASHVDVMLTGVDCFADGRVVIVGEEGVLLLSDDDGKTFRRLEQFVSAGTLWCVKRYAEAVLVGGEDGLVMRLGDLAAKRAAPKAQALAAPPRSPAHAEHPAWAAPPPSTGVQAWPAPPPMPLEIVRGVYVTPELRAMLYPRRGGITVPLRPLPTLEEAWGSLRRALWAADHAHMNRKSERSGIWNLVTSNDANARRLGERIALVTPTVGTFADDAALVKLGLERYRTFIDQFHDLVWDGTADFLVASVGLAEAISRTFTGLDDELPYTGVGPFGRLRELMVLADDATYAEAKRAVIEALAREVPLAKEKRDNDRVADLHWAATFLLPLGPPEARSRADTPKGHEGAGDEERRIHDAALTFTGEFGNVNIHACGLASGDLATLELFRMKNRKTRHEFFSPSGRMYLASILEMEGSAAAREIAGMKPADPFDDDPHYNGRWCRLLAHIADDAAFEALIRERATKDGRIWGTAGLLLAARSDPARLLAFARKKYDAELAGLMERREGGAASEPEAPANTELGDLAEPFPYEPLPARRAAVLVTRQPVAPEMTWRDEEREVFRNQGTYENAVLWDGVPLQKCGPEAVEAFVAHHEKWAIPTQIEDLLLAPASMRPRLLALGFRFSGYQAARVLGKTLLVGGLDHLPVLAAALADPAAVEAALADAQPFGDVSLVPPVVMAFAGKKLKALARSWMLRHPVHAAAGAVAMVNESLDDAARALRYLDGRGKRDVILEHGAASGIESRVREILETDPLSAKGGKAKLPKLPMFATPSTLPPLVTKTKNTASAEEVSRLLLELAFSNADEIHPGVIAAKAKYTAESRAAFAWALFEAWLAMAADPKFGWCMQTVGFFGDDTSARKLAALAKVWPGEGASVRAQAALDALLNIGTDVALVNINLLAEKSRFPAFKAAARERIGAIADARGLSTDELQDRLVPSLGLDEAGGNVLDYGKRKFTIEFDEQLAAVLRDESGARLADAPKPTKTDDAALAKAAKARLSGLRKDARVSASLQIARLERAMCTGRTIERDVFIECFATHPWMRFLARRLVWAFNGVTFRVADDGSLADVRDATFELPQGASVRVVHPLNLDASERDAWAKVFGDYEIIQPFPQLARTVYEITDAERAGKSTDRFRGKTTTVGPLRGLETRGWERWSDDMVTGIGRRVGVGTSEVWVVIDVSPGWHPSETVDAIPSQTIEAIVMHGPPDVTFAALSPVVFSEIVYDAARLF